MPGVSSIGGNFRGRSSGLPFCHYDQWTEPCGLLNSLTLNLKSGKLCEKIAGKHLTPREGEYPRPTIQWFVAQNESVGFSLKAKLTLWKS